jgi:hypothetical protein
MVDMEIAAVVERVQRVAAVRGDTAAERSELEEIGRAACRERV